MEKRTNEQRTLWNGVQIFIKENIMIKRFFSLRTAQNRYQSVEMSISFGKILGSDNSYGVWWFVLNAHVHPVHSYNEIVNHERASPCDGITQLHCANSLDWRLVNSPSFIFLPIDLYFVSVDLVTHRCVGNSNTRFSLCVSSLISENAWWFFRNEAFISL